MSKLGQDTTTRSTVGWDVERSLDSGASWTFWQRQEASVLYRLYTSASQPTFRYKEGYRDPTHWQAYRFQVIPVRDGSIRLGIDDWPYDGNFTRHQRRYPTKPNSTNSSVGPGPIEYYGVHPSSLVPLIPPEVVSRMEARLAGKIRQASWDAGQALGELRESLEFIGSRVDVAQKLIRKARRTTSRRHWNKDYRAYRKVAPGTAKAYLSIIYGILPLMSDVYDALDLISNGLKKPLATVTVDQKDESFGQPSGLAADTVIVGKFVRGVKGSITFGCTNEALFDAWRLGLTNPVSLMYLLTPLSFVLDWFVHLGNFLQALLPPLGLVFKHGYMSKYMRIDATIYKNYPIAGPNQKVLAGSGWMARWLSNGFERSLYFAFPVPSPYIDLGTNVSQVLSIIALMVAMSD